MNQNMITNKMKMVFDISRGFDIPLNKVLSDLEKLESSLEGGDVMETLIYYYKSKIYGMD